MADKNIHEGDEVSWKWGRSEPTGTVAEIKTEGKLEIETKGKLIHKNADPDNPAVHVERTGNDVVKRASELTKLSSSAEGGQVNVSRMGEHQDDAGEEESHEKLALKKRGPRKKSNAAAITGEKRVAGEAADSADEDTEEASQKTKKMKTSDVIDDGEKKISGLPKKDIKAHDKKKQTKCEAMDVDANPPSSEGTAASKNTGRPKKSDAPDHPPTKTPVDTDAPAANTRSKD